MHIFIAFSERAVITELPDQYTVYAGSMIDIPCYVTGTPFPDVWWTKRSDVRFRRNGSRLIEKNVQVEQRIHVDIAMVLGSFQCRGVLLLLHIVGQGPAVLAVGAERVGYIFYIFHLSSFSNNLSF